MSVFQTPRRPDEPTLLLVCDWTENHPSCPGYRARNHPEGFHPGTGYWRPTAVYPASNRAGAERWAGSAGLIVELLCQEARVYYATKRLPDAAIPYANRRTFAAYGGEAE